jgi:hypothetical protein
MKKTYQIDKQRAAQQFGKQAGATNQQLQFALKPSRQTEDCHCTDQGVACRRSNRSF